MFFFCSSFIIIVLILSSLITVNETRLCLKIVVVIYYLETNINRILENK